MRLALSSTVDTPIPPNEVDPDQFRDAAQHEAALAEEELRLRGAQYRDHGLLAETAKRLMVMGRPERRTYRDPQADPETGVYRKFSMLRGRGDGVESIRFEDAQVEEKDERSRTVRYEQYVLEEKVLESVLGAEVLPRKYFIWKRADHLKRIDNETHVTLKGWDEPATEADPDTVKELNRMLSQLEEEFRRPRAN
ncbi:MAG: hypothetical protein M3N59_03080 [bacterium]|nr:hypothetical protein [bacterium]